MEVLFIRHGESVSNQWSKYNIHGNPQKDTSLYHDSPLSNYGKNECYSVRPLTHDDADVVFVSPLTRALNTASIICRNIKNKVYVLREVSEFEKICKNNKINSFSNSFRNIDELKEKYKSFNWNLVESLSIFRYSKKGYDNDKIQQLLCQFLVSYLASLKYKKIIENREIFKIVEKYF